MEGLHDDAAKAIAGQISAFCDLLALSQVNRRFRRLALAYCAELDESPQLLAGYYRSAGGCTCATSTAKKICFELTAKAFDVLRADEGYGAGSPSTCTVGTGRLIWHDARGLLHRSGGLPAVDWDFNRAEYWVHGQRHRADGGPAVHVAGARPEYWICGVDVSAPL
jgi:hypothetical protein